MLQLDSHERVAVARQVSDVVDLSDFYATSRSSELDHVAYVQVAWYTRLICSLLGHVERVV